MGSLGNLISLGSLGNLISCCFDNCCRSSFPPVPTPLCISAFLHTYIHLFHQGSDMMTSSDIYTYSTWFFFNLCIISEIPFYFYYTYSKTLNMNTYVGLITIARVDLPRCFALEFWQFSYTEPINRLNGYINSKMRYWNSIWSDDVG